MTLGGVPATPDSPSADELRALAERRFVRAVALVGRKLRARFESHLRLDGQTLPRWQALWWVVDATEGLSQSELAERSGIETSNLARILQQLETEGLIVRQSAPHDRRLKVVKATPAANSAIAAGEDFAARLRDHLLRQVQSADLAASTHLLELVVQELDCLPGSINP